jgi:transcriptional regulator with XRE-family HTH domain
MLIDDARHSRLSRRVDDHVGSRIRLRRTLLGMTQEQLAAALSISYQQIQKYETGANRVSAGRLFEIAQRLSVDVGYFFEGLDPEMLPKGLPHGGRNRIAIDLVRNFLEIADEDQRSALANLVKTLKGNGHAEPQMVTMS